MQVFNTSIPDITGGNRKGPTRREAAGYKLSRIKDIIEASGEDIKSIPVASELRLTANDIESVIRAFKTVKYPVDDNYIDMNSLGSALRSSERYEDVIRPLLLIQANPVTHTNLFSIKQVEAARYSIASSIMMLAARESQGIPYSFWYNTIHSGDRYSKKLAYNRLFFNSFANALESVNVEEYDSMVITEEDREALIKKGNPRGWYLNKFDADHLMPGYKWHYYIKHMKLNTWIFHPSAYDENSMIFHPSNWDYIPEKNVVRATQHDDGLV